MQRRSRDVWLRKRDRQEIDFAHFRSKRFQRRFFPEILIRGMDALITPAEITSADALVEAPETSEADVAAEPPDRGRRGGRAPAADHPFVTRTTVPMTALAGIPVVRHHRDNGLRSRLDQEAARCGAGGGDADEAGGDGGSARGGGPPRGTGPGHRARPDPSPDVAHRGLTVPGVRSDKLSAAPG